MHSLIHCAPNLECWILALPLLSVFTSSLCPHSQSLALHPTTSLWSWFSVLPCFPLTVVNYVHCLWCSVLFIEHANFPWAALVIIPERAYGVWSSHVEFADSHWWSWVQPWKWQAAFPKADAHCRCVGPGPAPGPHWWGMCLVFLFIYLHVHTLFGSFLPPSLLASRKNLFCLYL
jgi:hypothetical protein